MLLTEMSAYSNAVQQYGRNVADFWAQYDFSPTKRYVKKMCDLFYIDKIPQNEITKIFRAYQENAEWFDAMGINFNELSWDKLKELVLRHIGEYENVSELPNQFYVSDDGLINIGYFNTFEEAMNFEPQNGWCTSVNQGRFEEHHNINHEMLYIIRNCKLSKSSNCRFVVAQVNLDGSRIYWDQKNNNLNATNGDNHISAKEYETSLGNAINQLQPMKLKTENKQYKSNTNMNKKLIRLTESDLHRIVKESVNRILKEDDSTPNIYNNRSMFAKLMYQTMSKMHDINETLFYNVLNGRINQFKILSNEEKDRLVQIADMANKLDGNMAYLSEMLESQSSPQFEDEPEDWYERNEHGDFDTY